MLELAAVLLVVGAIVVLLGPRIMRRRGLGGRGGPGNAGGQLPQGTLLITGVSSGADSDGSQSVTITGVINGPTVSDHEIYTSMVMKVGTAPTIGQLMPIVYSPKNPDKWGFAPPDLPEQPDYPPPPPN